MMWEIHLALANWLLGLTGSQEACKSAHQLTHTGSDWWSHLVVAFSAWSSFYWSFLHLLNTCPISDPILSMNSVCRTVGYVENPLKLSISPGVLLFQTVFMQNNALDRWLLEDLGVVFIWRPDKWRGFFPCALPQQSWIDIPFLIFFLGLALKSQQSGSFDNRTSVVGQPVAVTVTTFNICQSVTYWGFCIYVTLTSTQFWHQSRYSLWWIEETGSSSSSS